MRAMKYTVSIEIDLPRERVVQMLADPAHLPKWLRGLVLHEPLSGVHGAVGTKSRVVMRMGQRKIECTEIITRREPVELRGIPKGSVVHFDREIAGEGMWSAMRDRLTEAGPEKTLWVSESEYRYSGLLMRLVGLLMPGAFRKQSQQHMRDFKAFAEQGKTSAKRTDGVFALVAAPSPRSCQCRRAGPGREHAGIRGHPPDWFGLSQCHGRRAAAMTAGPAAAQRDQPSQFSRSGWRTRRRGV
ncbi:hypothetical protein GCM10029964_085500 [Kibdelosporangium lantanae]